MKKYLCTIHLKTKKFTTKKTHTMEQFKKFIGLMLPALAAVAAYDLVIKPLINKAKTSLPASASTSTATV